MFKKIQNNLKLYLDQFKTWLLSFLSKQDLHPVRYFLILSFIMIVIIEMLNRRSLVGWVLTLTQNPIMFLYNYLIVLLTLSVGFLVKRKHFVFILISVIWFGLSLTNFIMLGYRTTPLTAIDFNLFLSVASILKVYLTPFKMIFFSGLIVTAIIFVLYTFRVLPKTKVKLKLTIAVMGSIPVLMVLLFALATQLKLRTDEFNNIAEAFQDYGFAYCFTTSIFDRGINEPSDYSEQVVEDVLAIIESDSNPTLSQINNYHSMDIEHLQLIETTMIEMINARALDYLKNSAYTIIIPDQPLTPNVVFVQLESFFDVNDLVNFEFSENPVPYFTSLKEDYSTGYLTVPSIGAGTANTEFEILSGMKLSFFGAGEYPFKTILKETTVESICYNLTELGYHNHAIHNNSATFYSRNQVYPMLGFDSFSSIEFMDSVVYNPLGWAKDAVLIEEIIEALNYTDEQDFIFAVSVQPHGKYPEEVINENQFITIAEKTSVDSDLQMEESLQNQYEYFLHELNETDQFLEDLLLQLSSFDEPVVVVLYGDHLPSLGLENESLDYNNKFQTEYVLWSNFPMQQIKKDLTAYQLTAYVLERLGMDNGILTKFHQKSSHLSNYEEELLLLQYDMLYGDLTVYNGLNPYPIKPMVMGYKPVTISDVQVKGEALIITGDYFTRWSQVILDGVIMDTLYLDENTLVLSYQPQNYEQQLFVGIVGSKELVLSQSDPWIIPSNFSEE